MSKDPAFLFYSKDWLEGTAEMTSEEKGVYIDLLCHQHQKGGLPTEMKRLCKLVGLGETDFMKIWPDIQHKFKVNSDNRLVNRKLTEVITERLEKGHKNKIISALAVAVRQSNLPYEVKYEAKKGFNVLDFFNIPEPKITESVTEWFSQRLKSIANANEDANANANEDRGGVGGKEGIAPEMFSIFKKHNSKYPPDKEKDFSACLQLAYKIADSKGWDKNDVILKKRKEILQAWEKIVLFTVTDKWFSKRALYDLSNEWQRLIQSMNGQYTAAAAIKDAPTSVKKESETDFDKYRKKQQQ